MIEHGGARPLQRPPLPAQAASTPAPFLVRKLAGYAARHAWRREQRRAAKLSEAGARSGAQILHGFIQININPRVD